jgi:surface antigen
MSSFDDRDRRESNGLQVPGLLTQLSLAQPLPLPQDTALLGRPTLLLDDTSDLTISGPLPNPALSPDAINSLPGRTTSLGVSRVLPDIHTGILTPLCTRSTTTSLRQPVVIRTSTKQGPRTIRPPKGRKWVISLAAISLLFVLTMGTAFAVSPLGSEHGSALGPLQLVAQLVHTSSNNPSLAAQMATATAIPRTARVTPISSSSGSPLPPPTAGGGLNHFALGECTYWADLRYHQLTGWWVPWTGNAYQWATGAAASGWIVSSTPKVPSIIVLQPGVQGAFGLGHVAVVERINTDGSVYTSNYNWYANGGWDTLSYWTFTPGPGVSFVWHR